MLKKCLCAAVAALAAPCVTPAAAATVFYTDQAAFLAAAPGAADPTGMSTVADDAAALALQTANGLYDPYGAAPQPTADIDLGPVRFVYGQADGNLAQRAHGFFNTGSYTDKGIDGAAYQVYNPINENHSIEIDAGAGALGFSIFDPADGRCYVTCGASVFKIDIYDLFGALLGSTTTAQNYGGTTFFGVVSDVAFGLVVVSEITSNREPYDNEYFGNYLFLAAEAGGLETPVPAAGLLMLSGLAFFARRRPRRA